MMALSGSLQVRNYDNAEGKKVYVTEVVANEVYFAESKKETSIANQGDLNQVAENCQNGGVEFE